MTNHQLKEIKLAWANGVLVQFYESHSDKWCVWMSRSSIDLDYAKYWRIKPETIDINGFEVPKPLSAPPLLGQIYYIPTIAKMFSSTMSYTWEGDRLDRHLLNSGVVHLDNKSAILHYKALLSFTKDI